ncbi:uncharacterized protein LOC119602451 [Lucilia sericata]|uniref:uncharacterized protein LOC119602451 n=1 Tax=Lucilia sericata TaxID=13632 RepID=UPI0018A85ED1|nr:uncharacterized protein LOC119602451 [Lucilia sericata]
MGAPELPNDPGEEDLRTTHIVHHPPAPSDDSDDNESLQDAGAYEGYQPLSMDENNIDYGHMRLNAHDDDDDVNDAHHNREGFTRIQENRNLDEDEPLEVVHGDPNMPQIETADAEIERAIWSQPRPQELQIELDGNKTQQILNAMANFQLPNLAVPEWAAGVPEERWKEELLQRIRQRKPSDDSSKMEVNNESK